MLNDFVEKKGTLVVPKAKNIVIAIKKRAIETRKEGTPVIYINDTHHEKDSEFVSWPKHAVRDSWGGEVVKELKPRKNDFVISKTRYSGFYGTGLDQLLRELGVKELIISGVVTNICIYLTAVDAYMRGYKVVVPEDSVAALDEKDQEFVFNQMKTLLNAQIV